MGKRKRADKLEDRIRKRERLRKEIKKRMRGLEPIEPDEPEPQFRDLFKEERELLIEMEGKELSVAKRNKKRKGRKA